MKHRLFRRRAFGFAVISGVSGIVANLSLAGFFAMARPLGDASSRWAWLGPANDVTGAISMAALIPVVVHLGQVTLRTACCGCWPAGASWRWRLWPWWRR